MHFTGKEHVPPKDQIPTLREFIIIGDGHCGTNHSIRSNEMGLNYKVKSEELSICIERTREIPRKRWHLSTKE